MTLRLKKISASSVPGQGVCDLAVSDARRRPYARAANLALGATVHRSHLTTIPTQGGFAGFEMVDSNLNSRIDAAFSQLRVWRDLNQDGISDSGELITLAEAASRKSALRGMRPRSVGLCRLNGRASKEPRERSTTATRLVHRQPQTRGWYRETSATVYNLCDVI
jgi:hypothetical protein